MLLEHTREMGLVAEASLERNFGNRPRRLLQARHRVPDAKGSDLLADGRAVMCPKARGEMDRMNPRTFSVVLQSPRLWVLSFNALADFDEPSRRISRSFRAVHFCEQVEDEPFEHQRCHLVPL